MTKGNGVEVPTPFMPSTATGGNPATYGLDEGTPGDLSLGTVGSDAGSPAGSTTLSEGGYGCGPGQANDSMRNMAGPGSIETTFSNTNADASGNQSMQDMSGPSLGAQTQTMNTDSAGRWSQTRGGNDDRNWNDMASME